MLRLNEHWVWDSWYFDDGEYFHCFFLKAPRSLIDPQLRHLQASVGHARSKDLKNWEVLQDALAHSESPAFDQNATWTGSVVLNPADGLYYMFYTGATKNERGVVQSIGFATSKDLIFWEKYSNNPVLVADSNLYTTQENGDENTDCRDPWIFYLESDNKWHMTFTANKIGEDFLHRGVVGHAISDDLKNWKITSALSPASGFGQVEVTQLVEISGKWVLIFCCSSFNFDEEKKKKFITATFSCPAAGPLGPFSFEKSEMISPNLIYAGRIVQDRNGDWNLLGFKAGENDSKAECWISDPIPVTLTEAGVLVSRI